MVLRRFIPVFRACFRVFLGQSGRGDFPSFMPQAAHITVTVLTYCLVGSVLAVAAASLQRTALRRQRNGVPPLPSGRVEVWPYFWPDWLWMGVIVLFFGVAMGLGNASAGPAEPGAEANSTALLMNIGFQIFLAGVTVLVMLGRVRPDSWLGLRMRGWYWLLLAAPACVAAVWITGALINLAGYQELMKQLGMDPLQHSVKVFKDSPKPEILGLMALAAVVVAPVCEEIIFRGYLYPAAKRFAGRWVAFFASAAVFAMAHGTLPQLPMLFLLGLTLALSYELTGSIWAPIAIHFCNNAFTVLILAGLRISGVEIPAWLCPP